MKEKLYTALMQSTDFYSALGYLMCLAALGRYNVLWLNYYTFRAGKDMPFSDGVLLQELHHRLSVEHGDDQRTSFWELITLEDRYPVLRETYYYNVIWSEECKTFFADDYDTAIQIAERVLNIKLYTNLSLQC